MLSFITEWILLAVMSIRSIYQYFIYIYIHTYIVHLFFFLLHLLEMMMMWWLLSLLCLCTLCHLQFYHCYWWSWCINNFMVAVHVMVIFWCNVVIFFIEYRWFSYIYVHCFKIFFFVYCLLLNDVHPSLPWTFYHWYFFTFIWRCRRML